MIQEIIMFQAEMHRRAIFVGRVIQEWKHFACTGITIPIIAPYVIGIDEQVVSIAIAYNEDGLINIPVPVSLFEAGSIGDIRTWITRSNKAREDAIEQERITKEDAKKSNELAILKELRTKYNE